MTLRNNIADNEGLAPYMVMSNKNLQEMAAHRPSSLESMNKIEGLSNARISKFGKQFLDFVVSYCKENNLEEDDFSDEKETKSVSLIMFKCLLLSNFKLMGFFTASLIYRCLYIFQVIKISLITKFY